VQAMASRAQIDSDLLLLLFNTVGCHNFQS
jgi:hypothetical protein